MKVHVKHTIKSDVASVFKLCTDQKNQESIYSQLGGTDIKIKREVSESSYKAWPASLQKLFTPHRTVSGGKATYKMEAKKE